MRELKEIVELLGNVNREGMKELEDWLVHRIDVDFKSLLLSKEIDNIHFLRGSLTVYLTILKEVRDFLSPPDKESKPTKLKPI